jgi:hypothetical protein
MADATFPAIDAHGTVGEFKITLHYDDVSLLITSADVLNSTGDTQHVTVGTHVFDVVDATNINLPLSSFAMHMVIARGSPHPPVFIG